MIEENPPHRLGVIVMPARKLNESALQFLILAMNKEQARFQFEFYDLSPADHPLLEILGSGKTVDRAKAEGHMSDFVERARACIDSRSKQMELAGEEPPEHFVIVSQCRFDDNYYSSGNGDVSVLALGNWKRAMAPPSFVEFVQALLVREAVGALCPSLTGSVHLGTKGCLLDFTERLADARQKVFRGYVCHHCRSRMQQDGQPVLANTVTHLLDREWLGQPTDPRAPAGVMINLRYDLFTAKGRQETPIEVFLTALRQEGAKQIATTVGAVLVAILIYILGVKTGSR